LEQLELERMVINDLIIYKTFDRQPLLVAHFDGKNYPPFKSSQQTRISIFKYFILLVDKWFFIIPLIERSGKPYRIW